MASIAGRLARSAAEGVFPHWSPVRLYATARHEPPKTNQQERAIRIQQQERRLRLRNGNAGNGELRTGRWPPQIKRHNNDKGKGAQFEHRRQIAPSRKFDDKVGNATSYRFRTGQRPLRVKRHNDDRGFQSEDRLPSIRSRKRYDDHKRPQSEDSLQFVLSRQLADLRKGYGRTSATPNATWASATEIFRKATRQTRVPQILWNQMIDLALSCGKRSEAQSLWIDMKKHGTCPNIITINNVFGGLLRNPPSIQDSKILAWMDGCYQELEALREEALCSKTNDASAPADVKSKSRYEVSRFAVIAKIRANPQRLTQVYSVYVALSLQVHRDDAAWETASRHGTDFYNPGSQGFPCVTTDLFDRWLGNYVSSRDLLETDSQGVQRTLDLAKRWLQVFRSHMQPTLDLYNGAGSQEEQQAVAEVWQKHLAISCIHVHQLVLIASFNPSETEFQSFVLELVRQMTPFDTENGGGSLWSAPPEFRDGSHPLYSLLRIVPRDFDSHHHSPNSADVKRFFRALCFSLPRFNLQNEQTTCDMSRLRIGAFLQIANKAFEYAAARRRDDDDDDEFSRGDRPEHGGLAETDYHAIFDDFLSSQAALHDLDPTDPRSPRLAVRVISTLRELHKAGLSPRMPYSVDYMKALRCFTWADEQAFQLCRWWLEDRADLMQSRKGSTGLPENPWDVSTLYVAHYFITSHARVIFDSDAVAEKEKRAAQTRQNAKDDTNIAAEKKDVSQASTPTIKLSHDDFHDELILSRSQLAREDIDVDDAADAALRVAGASSVELTSAPQRDMGELRAQAVRALQLWYEAFAEPGQPPAQSSADDAVRVASDGRRVNITLPTLAQVLQHDPKQRLTAEKKLGELRRGIRRLAHFALETGDRRLGPLRKDEVALLKAFFKESA